MEKSLERLTALKRLGILLAIDDFGTGYSSLSYLQRFPIDVVKIDKSFVDGLGTESQDTQIVAAIVSLAKALNLRTVAEGVETPRQLEALVELGCDEAQGYLLGKPMPLEGAELCPCCSVERALGAEAALRMSSRAVGRRTTRSSRRRSRP